MDGIKIGLIGGSGLADVLLAGATAMTRHEVTTPFGQPSDAIIETTWAGVPIFILARHGEAHTIAPSFVPYRANIFALKQLGCTHVLASGAVGSLREEIRPRDLVVIDQIIDKTTKRAATFYERAAVHVDFSEPMCPVLRKVLVDAAGDLAIHDKGCYVVMEGPAFSTRAESLMHRLWGGDLVGMTAMPEAKLAREAELPYALVALVTDYDSWKARSGPAIDHATVMSEILAHLKAASENGVRLMQRAIELIAGNPERIAECPARDALKLAIWTQKTKIPSQEIERLAPLWSRYFS